MKRIKILACIVVACLSCLNAQSANAQDESVPVCRVDFNKDGIITTDDIWYLADPLHPELDSMLDLDGNGEVNGDDGVIFTNLLGSTHVVGDYNNSGNVSVSDLSIFLGAFGTFDPCIDLNGDGFVYNGDLDLFLNEYFGS